MERIWSGIASISTGGCGSKLIAGAWSLAGTATVALPLLFSAALAQSPQARPVINVASVILAEPAVETPFPIQIGPAEAIPQQTFLRIRGLPGTATLSEGHAIAAGAWAIPLSGLPRLKIATPIGASGKADVTISLVAIDGTILSEVKSTLLIAPASVIAPAVRDPTPQSANTASLGPAASVPLPTGPIRPQVEVRPQPPVPVVPQISAADRERALKHMEKGDESFAAGNLTVARLFYQRAADLGWGPGALALAATFDPIELSRMTVVGGVQADAAQARKWYERARELGAPEASDRLQRLGAR